MSSSSALSTNDFQCLQDQLVDLKTKNYDLLSKYATASKKITSLHQQLEEQENNFRLITNTLKSEIETITSDKESNKSCQDNYKVKYEQVKEQENAIRNQMQQLDIENKSLNEQLNKFSQDNLKQIKQRDELLNKIKSIKSSLQEAKKRNKSYEDEIEALKQTHSEELDHLSLERDSLKQEVERLRAEVKNFDSRQAHERKIQEKKGLQIVKELKRQLALETKRAEKMQERLKEVLNSSATTQIDAGVIATSSSNAQCESNNENASSENNKSNIIENGSVGSWSFLQANINNLTESLSLCSIDSNDCGTLQVSKDDTAENSSQLNDSSNENKRSIKDKSPVPCAMSGQNFASESSPFYPKPKHERAGSSSSFNLISDRQLIEEQATLVQRLTELQQEKWHLEEKSSYLEQVNMSLVNELADKTDLIKNYFMNQAAKAIYQKGGFKEHHLSTLVNNNKHKVNNNNSKQAFIQNETAKQILEKPGVKKVVDFLIEHSHMPSNNDSDNIKTQALIQMQKMLEETLVKLMKAQESTLPS